MWKATWSGLLAHKLRLGLTAMAVVLGVAFVSGTFILTDTLHNTFNSMFGSIYSGVDLSVRSRAAFTANGFAQRNPISDHVLGQVQAVPGVKAAEGSVGGYAQLVDPKGKAIAPVGPPTIGLSVGTVDKLTPLKIRSGRRPQRDGEVVVDSHTAKVHGFKVGQRITVLFQGPSEQFTVVGIIKFGDVDSLAGATIAGFDLKTAQRVLHRQGQLDSVDLVAQPGTNHQTLAARVARAVPKNLEVVTGQTLADENTAAINHGLNVFTKALLVFALISLFVGAFIIFNTFNILVTQRTRELALLRVLGAGRAQVLGSVVLEALVVGLVGSIAGLALGMGFASLLQAMLRAFGITLPTTALVFKSHTVIAGLGIGVGVTVLSSINPALRASRVSPIEALSDQPMAASASLRRRVVVGTIVFALGLAGVGSGLATGAASLVGLGAVIGFVGAAMLAPMVARPLAAVIGAPLARLLRTPGRLGQENAMRSPRRTAATAAALMVGLALVSTMAVFGASLTRSATSTIDDAIRGDYVVSTSSFALFSASVPRVVQHQPGVAVASAVYQGPFRLGSSVKSLQGISPADIDKTLILKIEKGSTIGLSSGQLLVDTTTAAKDELTVGQHLPATFARTGETDLEVGGIYKPNQLLGSYLVSDTFFIQHFNDALPLAVVVKAEPGSSLTKAQLERSVKPFPNLVVRTQAEFKAYQRKQVNQLLGIIYVLLGLAVVIALMGIVNTLVLSVIERTKEIGLLRAVGMRRRQVRTMIRAESVIVSVFGSILGLAIGTGFGVALSLAMHDQGVTEIVVPGATLVVFLVLAALAGLAAASWPARKAARLDVLRAIAST